MPEPQSKPVAFTLAVQKLVGKSPGGTLFCVGQVDGSPRWIGFALMPGLVYVLPGVSEGHVLGLIEALETSERDAERVAGQLDRWADALEYEFGRHVSPVPREMRGLAADLRRDDKRRMALYRGRAVFARTILRRTPSGGPRPDCDG